MTTHVVHVLDQPEPYRIEFHRKFQEAWHEFDFGQPFRSVSQTVKVQDTPDDDESERALLDTFVVRQGRQAWAFSDADEVTNFLQERGTPIYEGLSQALADEPSKVAVSETANSSREWAPDLLNVDGYTVYGGIYPICGEDYEYRPWGTVSEALSRTYPAYIGGSTLIQVGSLVLQHRYATAGRVNPQTDSVENAREECWEAPQLAALLEREAAAQLAPTP